MPPKCPNARADVRVPIHEGGEVLSCTPRPQSRGSKRPWSGRTPARPGNWTATISSRVSGATSRGWRSSRPIARTSSSDAVHSGTRIARRVEPDLERDADRSEDVLGERHLGPTPRGARREPGTPRSSRSGGARAARSAPHPRREDPRCGRGDGARSSRAGLQPRRGRSRLPPRPRGTRARSRASRRRRAARADPRRRACGRGLRDRRLLLRRTRRATRRSGEAPARAAILAP